MAQIYRTAQSSPSAIIYVCGLWSILKKMNGFLRLKILTLSLLQILNHTSQMPICFLKDFTYPHTISVFIFSFQNNSYFHLLITNKTFFNWKKEKNRKRKHYPLLSIFFKPIYCINLSKSYFFNSLFIFFPVNINKSLF